MPSCCSARRRIKCVGVAAPTLLWRFLRRIFAFFFFLPAWSRFFCTGCRSRRGFFFRNSERCRVRVKLRAPKRAFVLPIQRGRLWGGKGKAAGIRRRAERALKVAPFLHLLQRCAVFEKKRGTFLKVPRFFDEGAVFLCGSPQWADFGAGSARRMLQRSITKAASSAAPFRQTPSTITRSPGLQARRMRGMTSSKQQRMPLPLLS